MTVDITMTKNVSSVERLPCQSSPAFDCDRANAGCPACSSGHPGRHGNSGGTRTFAVRGTLPDGRRIAVSLQVLLADYLECTPRTPSRPRKARGAFLERHLEILGDPSMEQLRQSSPCLWIGDDGKPRRCDDGGSRGELSFLGADELYSRHGSASGSAGQSDDFWAAMEEVLDAWAADVPPISEDQR